MHALKFLLVITSVVRYAAFNYLSMFILLVCIKDCAKSYRQISPKFSDKTNVGSS